MKKIFQVFLLITAAVTAAEQKQSFEQFDVHYVVFPTTFLSAKMATRYDIVRAPDRALVNISVINKEGRALRGVIKGTTKNLLSQRSLLTFEEVVEQDAVYYLAEFKHTDRDVLKFTIEVSTAGETQSFDFQQTMYIKR